MDSLSGARISLVTPDTPASLDATRAILREYAATLGVDLGFQGFEAELAGLPGAYAPPQGELLLACVQDRLAGCGAFRPLRDVDDANACEMKRLYVRPGFRGLGLGRMLAQALVDRARQAGYRVMLLDTLNDMAAARELYGSLGFIETEPYYFNPIAGSHYFRLELDVGMSRY
jgi:GNAT superfamily N-acetyltransferase